MTNTLTVHELITLLNDCDPNAKVVIEGCDCTGDAVSVRKPGAFRPRAGGPLYFGPDPGTILIERYDEYRDGDD